MMEKSKLIQSVIFSLGLHFCFLFLLYQIDTKPPRQKSLPVEVDLHEYTGTKIAPTLKAPPNLLNDFKKEQEQHFLSQVKQRVKQEMMSPNLGESKNKNQKNQKKESVNTVKALAEASQFSLPRQKSFSYTEDLQSQFDFRNNRIQKGNLTLLNTDYATFASFYDRISPRIRYNWVRGVSDYLSDRVVYELLRINKNEWVTKVEVILDKTGNLLKTIVINSSGSQQLDQPILDAFDKATPFVNPPAEMVQEDGKIHLYYVFVLEFNPQYFVRTK